jgi:hypothetical protein
MKRLLASSLLATLASASTWYKWDAFTDSTPINLGGHGFINYGYDFELEYYTFYRAGEGPYYGEDNSGTAIYSTMDDSFHYEEYGFSVDNWGIAYVDFSIGSYSPSSDWIFRL